MNHEYDETQFAKFLQIFVTQQNLPPPFFSVNDAINISADIGIQYTGANNRASSGNKHDSTNNIAIREPVIT